MNKEEALAGLYKLRKAMQELTDLQSALGTIQDNIDALKNYIPHALNDFDLAHKDAYIISNIGEAPPKPGNIQQILPWTKKEVQAYNAYLKQYNEFEDKYYEEFSEQRENVRAEEEKIVQSEMDDYINRQKVYLKNSEELKESIEADTLLDNGQSRGFAKFYATVDLRQVNREIADSDHFYHGRLGVNESGGCILRIGLNDGLMVLFCDFYRCANETKC